MLKITLQKYIERLFKISYVESWHILTGPGAGCSEIGQRQSQQGQTLFIDIIGLLWDFVNISYPRSSSAIFLYS